MTRPYRSNILIEHNDVVHSVMYHDEGTYTTCGRSTFYYMSKGGKYIFLRQPVTCVSCIAEESC